MVVFFFFLWWCVLFACFLFVIYFCEVSSVLCAGCRLSHFEHGS